MKKIFSIFLGLALVLVLAGNASAIKPAENLASAQKVDWNLSSAVMPVPPYGSMDIEGSDTMSKLIVNQPNGDVEVVINGVMKGLHPDTTYTVYLSKGYTAYTPLSILETYTWMVLGTYHHDLVIDVQNPDGTFSGYGGYPAGEGPDYDDPGQTAETITGQIVGNTVTFTTTYSGPYNPGYTATVVGTIAGGGSMSGTSPWEWHTTSGSVTLASGSTGWPGLLTSTVQPFTFVTDEYGMGNWHLNLRDDDFLSGPGPYNLSVWINEAGRTMLISDTFEVVVD